MYLVYRSATGAGVYTEQNAPSLAGLAGLSSIVLPSGFSIGSYGCVVSGETITNNLAPITPEPTLAQQAAVALASGLAITLSGTITLAATVFPVDPTTTAKIGAVVTTILARGTFPGGAETYPLKDVAGAWHTFSIAQYEMIAGAIAAYVAELDLIIDGNPNGATELPAAAASLTV